MKAILITSLILLLATSVQSAEKGKKTAPKKEVKKDLVTTSLDYVDDTQGLIADSWLGLNYNIDSFFSDRRYKATENRSKVMLYWVGQKKESKEFENNFDFAFKVHLPQTTKRLSITLEKERNEILDATSSTASKYVNKNAKPKSDPQATQNNYAAAASYLLVENPIWKSSLTTGMKLLLPLDPFTKLSIYNDHRWKYFHLGAEQKFIFYRQDGFSEFTKLAMGIPISPKFYLSQNNVLAWNDKDDRFELRNDLSLGQAIDETKGISYSVGANALLSPTLYYTGYDASISYRQRLFRDWFFGALTIGTEFLKKYNYSDRSFVQIRFDIQ